MKNNLPHTARHSSADNDDIFSVDNTKFTIVIHCCVLKCHTPFVPKTVDMVGHMNYRRTKGQENGCNKLYRFYEIKNHYEKFRFEFT